MFDWLFKEPPPEVRKQNFMRELAKLQQRGRNFRSCIIPSTIAALLFAYNGEWLVAAGCGLGAIWFWLLVKRVNQVVQRAVTHPEVMSAFGGQLPPDD